MIGKNWKKSLVVAGAVLAVAAAIPAFTQARTPLVTPPSVELTTTPVVVSPVKKTKKLVHHKLTKKTAVKKAPVKLSKHKVSKKHTKLSTGLSAKKHTV